MTDQPVYLVVAAAAAALGIALGAVLHRTRFCTLAALAEAIVLREFDHLRAWILAAAIALVGTQLVILTTDIPLTESIWLSPSLFWAGAIAGGLMFGYGMVLASGCAVRSTIHAASGDMRALVALVTTGLFAYMTMRGVIGPVQTWMRDTTSIDLGSTQDLATLLTPTATDSAVTRVLLAALITGSALAFCLRSRSFRQSVRFLGAATALGAAVPAAWLITGMLGADDFEPTALESLSFVQPTADSVMHLLTFTGSQINFGIALLGGVLLGAGVSARLGGTRGLKGFEGREDTVRYLLGGALMGTGGVLAGGCTIGQGVTGIATLSAGAFIAVGAIVTGAGVAIVRRERNRLRRQDKNTNPAAAANPLVVPALAGSDFTPCGN